MNGTLTMTEKYFDKQILGNKYNYYQNIKVRTIFNMKSKHVWNSFLQHLKFKKTLKIKTWNMERDGL